MRGTKKYNINISGIIIEVTKKRVKNLHLAVHPPFGEVKITAPLYLKESDITEFVISKLEWIKKHQFKYAAKPRPVEYKYLSGETHYLFGEPFLLEIIEHDKRTKTKLNGGTIEIYIKQGGTKAERIKALENFYRKALIEKAIPIISKWEGIAGVCVTEFGIKKMKTRWGSCNIRVKRVWLSLELAKRSVQSLEFIILHELVHLLEKNHNAKFKAYMDRFMPEWRTCSKELNRFSTGSSSENLLS